MRAGALAALLVLGAAAAAAAQSPLVAELERISPRYDEDPAQIDTLREGLERAVTADPRPENLVALAQVWFMWGDIRARGRDDKLKAYDQGRQAAKRAMEAAPRNPVAHFWFATNTGRWGQVNGMMRSLFLLPDIKREIRVILDIDPGYTPVYALAGNVFLEVPGLLGGDLARAEQLFRTGLGQDPRYTSLRVGLAKVLMKQGHPDAARRELTAVLEEKAPRNRADWKTKDVPEARKLLERLGAGS